MTRPLRLAQIANGLAVSLVVCGLSAGLAALAGMESLFILVVTALSLLVANFAKPVLRHVSSEFIVGTLFMYIFFVAIGAGANWQPLVAPGILVGLFGYAIATFIGVALAAVLGL